MRVFITQNKLRIYVRNRIAAENKSAVSTSQYIKLTEATD